MKKYVAVAGNIGVGKSTLVEMLCVRLGWEPFYEPVKENPYLVDFYSDMSAWSFHSQVFFLARRLRSHYRLGQHPNSVVQDRSVYEDAEIFAQNLYLQGHISQRDYQTYRELYETTTRLLPPPDLVVYLQASHDVVMSRIAQRGRDYERAMPPEYISALNEAYNYFFFHYTSAPLLIVNTNQTDFVNDPAAVTDLLKRIKEHEGGTVYYTPLAGGNS